MKIKFLLLGTSLSFIPNLTFAQCVATQDCETLGYTETSCNGGKGVKCPFGNKWACLPTKESICKEEGFTLACNETGQTGDGDSCNGLYKQCSCDSSYQYTCSGTGYASGSGTACGGKYTACTCASGYEWKDGSCQPNYYGCTIGALFYSDNTCSNNLESDKTLLGIVIMEKTTTANGWIVTINPVQTGIVWSTETVDIPELTNYGNSSTYPAAWAAKNYNPSGTPSGKSWCLPSGGLLHNTLYNQTNLAKVNAGISTAKGKIIGDIRNSSETIGSSSEFSDDGIWFSSASTIHGTYFSYIVKNHIYGDFSVRPVLAF